MVPFHWSDMNFSPQKLESDYTETRIRLYSLDYDYYDDEHYEFIIIMIMVILVWLTFCVPGRLWLLWWWWWWALWVNNYFDNGPTILTYLLRPRETSWAAVILIMIITCRAFPRRLPGMWRGIGQGENNHQKATILRGQKSSEDNNTQGTKILRGQ